MLNRFWLLACMGIIWLIYAAVVLTATTTAAILIATGWAGLNIWYVLIMAWIHRREL